LNALEGSINDDELITTITNTWNDVVVLEAFREGQNIKPITELQVRDHFDGRENERDPCVINPMRELRRSYREIRRMLDFLRTKCVYRRTKNGEHLLDYSALELWRKLDNDRVKRLSQFMKMQKEIVGNPVLAVVYRNLKPDHILEGLAPHTTKADALTKKSIYSTMDDLFS